MDTLENEKRADKVNQLHRLLNQVQDFMERDSSWDEVLEPLEVAILDKLKALNH